MEREKNSMIYSAGEITQEISLEDDGYDYDLFQCENKKDGIIDKDEIIVITKAYQDKNEDVQELAMRVVMGENIPQENLGNLLEQTETIMIELPHISNPDEIVEDLLNLKVPQLIVSICPRESYKYVVKRLSFEGKFQVITLGNPNLEDYSDYGNRFVQYFEYSLQDKENFSETIRDLAAYRGGLMKEADVYQNLRRSFEKADVRGEKIIRKEDLQLDYSWMLQEQI